METKKTYQIVEVVLIALAMVFTAIGCERKLAKSPAEQTQSLIKAPTIYEKTKELGIIIERNVPVPMRDGTILRADVCRPDSGGPYPVLVCRTPYGKRSHRADYFVTAGYIVVIQDVRGRYESEGIWESHYRFQTHDAEDGYDTVEWAAQLPGSTGKVGTFGSSYAAFLQWRLAPLRPPSLVAMSACSIPAQIWYGDKTCTIRPGISLAWCAEMATDMTRRENLPSVHTSWEYLQLWQRESQEWLKWLPWLELPNDFFGYETAAMKDWLRDPHRDPWKLHEGCKDMTVPNLDVVGWYDYAHGDALLFRTMIKEARTEAARNGSRIIIGPWDHFGAGSPYGDIDFGPDAALYRGDVQLRWFDYWLKGKQNGVDKDPPVRIFVMGDNRWRDEQHWPLQRTKEKVLYITSDGHANTFSGNGRLVVGKPEFGGSDNYVYDPKNPVPTPYGANIPRACDQRPLAKREDILVYQTESLTERVEVTGNPVVELYASSSAPDTDWFVRLIDIHPDGLARDVSSGMVRARYREGFSNPKLINPGEIVKYIIRMSPTSNAFLPEHRIRLDITSSDFPNYDRNHNTAANQNADTTLVVANQTIYHGGEEATRIILPWIPNPAEEVKPVEEEKHEPDLEKRMYPLHQAAADGDIEQVKSLISNGANVNEKDKDDQTALNLAVRSGHKAMVELLIARGADVNGKGQYNAVPLHEAAWAGNKKIAELLIQKGANVNAKDKTGYQPLYYAIWKKDLDTAKILIGSGADIHNVKKGQRDYTYLHLTARMGTKEIAEMLIQKGTEIDAKDNEGMTPLHWALSRDSNDVAKLLLAKGADFSWTDKNGLTALHYAVVSGYQDIIKLLLAKGAKVDEKDDVYEFTALHYAARFGNKNVAELLIAKGADINAKDKWDYQPIHWAAHHDRADVVELLISKGADINAKTSLGQTPIQLAQERRNTKTVELLRKHGAKE